LPSNVAFNIQQLWASGGRTREPILIKFGIQQKITTSMTVTWSNINFFFKFNMADGRHVRKCWKCYNSLTNRPNWTKLGWSHPIMFPICPLWCSCHGNGALNILQLWASGGQTRDPILLKFGKQQQIRTTMTVTWSNIKIFKIQNGGRPPCSKILEIP